MDTYVVRNSFDIDIIDNGGKCKIFQGKFLQPGFVQYSFGLCLLEKENADKFVYKFVGCPLVVDHQDVTDGNVSDVGVGNITRVWYNDLDGWYWCEGAITDNGAVDLIKRDGYSISCQYEITEWSPSDRLHNGVKFDKYILDGAPEHLAIVKNPRYEGAMIAVNKGDEDERWVAIDGEHNKVSNSEEQEMSLKDELSRFVANNSVRLKSVLRCFVANNKKDEDGRWVTIKGTHVFIKEGQDVKDAMKEAFGDKENLTSEQIAHRKGGLLKKIDAAQRVGLKDKEKKLRDRYDKLRQQESEIRKQAESLKGKYERDDVEFDEEQVKKDIEVVKRYGYTDIDEASEFLGLDPDEYIEITGESYDDDESEDIVDQYKDQIPKRYQKNRQSQLLWLYKNNHITRSQWEDERKKDWGE